METIINRLEVLLHNGSAFINNTSVLELRHKPHLEKWSKQETLGHLIDSGVNNLQRFTEVQFKASPYRVKTYDQNNLVTANNYQNADSKELLNLWLSLNQRIKTILKNTPEEILNAAIELPNGTIADVRFLMIDYVDHLEHHLKQIINKA